MASSRASLTELSRAFLFSYRRLDDMCHTRCKNLHSHWSNRHPASKNLPTYSTAVLTTFHQIFEEFLKQITGGGSYHGYILRTSCRSKGWALLLLNLQKVKVCYLDKIIVNRSERFLEIKRRVYAELENHRELTQLTLIVFKT